MQIPHFVRDDKIWLPVSTPRFLLHESLAHGVDEIGVGGLRTGSTHLQGDLPAMIRRVKKHVGQHVFYTAGPGLALAVAVFDLVVERAGREVRPNLGRKLRSKLDKITSPCRRHLVGQRHAVLNR